MQDQVDMRIVPAYSRKGLLVTATIATNSRARFASAIIERWALISGEPDGEDSAGRRQLRQESANSIVGRACDVADAAFNEFEARGWLFETPDLSEIMDVD